MYIAHICSVIGKALIDACTHIRVLGSGPARPTNPSVVNELVTNLCENDNTVAFPLAGCRNSF